ncbi:S8 family peptidase [Namhaeicola litoreus]|uniref:S8 family serine peptidase n=1 Tax=Namhaeicola litoreus TaxID=1052145 RepID=A0ABW3Y4X6_9FLAO
MEYEYEFTGELIVQLKEGSGLLKDDRFLPLFDDTESFYEDNSFWRLYKSDISKEKLSWKNGWNEAHKLFTSHKEIINYVEPNFNIRQVFTKRYKPDCKEGGYLTQWGKLPNKNEFAWHLNSDRTQLLDARLPDNHESKIRIAHLDTGYDPDHISKPKYLKEKLGRNFIEIGQLPTDPGIGGILKQPGHGTGTLAILAGNKVNRENFNNYFGGAPFAEIIPIRIANSVILLQTKNFAKGVQHAIDNKCDVLTMSMGGVASKLWAFMVNKAYDSGIVMVTAAGNNFSRIPTKNLIYPARFNRVIAACGVTYANQPYFKPKNTINTMQGNWGPEKLMNTALSAFTPNIPWAILGCKTSFEMSGGGTSSATQQIGAAAALWLEKYKDFQYKYPWQKVEAVRHALFSTANDYGLEYKKVGNGVIKAKDAQKIVPNLSLSISHLDKVQFPFSTVLFGNKDNQEMNSREEMFETELAQLPQIGLLDFDEEESELFGHKIDKTSLVKKILNCNDLSDKLREKLNGLD